MKKITIIAEIGENYLGDLKIAKKLINKAKNLADFVKFQSYNLKCLKKKDPEYSWFKKVMLSDNYHKILLNHCKKKKINFLSSPFSLERAEFLCENLNQKTIKVASSKMTEKNLLKYINRKCKKVFLSTGMSNIKEIRKSLKYLDNVETVIMHCVSEYPLKYKNANLNVIKTFRKQFPTFEIGYSDHTIGLTASFVAVALGATVIEKHYTLDKKMPGTDHVLSATPEELIVMKKNFQDISVLLGNSQKSPTQQEKKIKNFMRNRFHI